jgi:hypothetical protein
MSINIVNGFAPGKEQQTAHCNNEGRHNFANNTIKKEYTIRATKTKFRRNPQNRTKQKMASVITRYWDKDMQASVDKKRALYYKDFNGIDMTYPEGSKLANVNSLHILSNNNCDNNFNVILGCMRSDPQEKTFVALKVSENRKTIKPELMRIFDINLHGMLEHKPNVFRGTLCNGLTQRYVCHGYRKNPLDMDIGEYAFNAGVSDTDKEFIKKGINELVGEIEKRAVAEMNTASMRVCAGYADFFKVQEKYGIPSVYDGGIATQVALSMGYCSRVHTDKDYFLTTLSVYDKEAGPNEVLYYFCFPTYNIAVPMRSGDIIVFNPLVPHCATNPSRASALIYSCYVSNKTCNTVAANTIDESK